MRIMLFPVLVLLFVLGGCSFNDTKPVIYKDKYIPVYVAPKPPEVPKPSLAIDKIDNSETVSDGELVKAYIITVAQLKTYTFMLERVIETYDELHQKTYARATNTLNIDSGILNRIFDNMGVKDKSTDKTDMPFGASLNQTPTPDDVSVDYPWSYQDWLHQHNAKQKLKQLEDEAKQIKYPDIGDLKGE